MVAGEGESTLEGGGSSMTAGEEFDSTFGSNDPRRRDNVVGAEPAKAKRESLVDKIKRALRISQTPQA